MTNTFSNNYVLQINWCPFLFLFDAYTSREREKGREMVAKSYHISKLFVLRFMFRICWIAAAYVIDTILYTLFFLFVCVQMCMCVAKVFGHFLVCCLDPWTELEIQVTNLFETFSHSNKMRTHLCGRCMYELNERHRKKTKNNNTGKCWSTLQCFECNTENPFSFFFGNH